MTSKDDVTRLAAEVKQREGGLHLLVNNAGIAGPKTKVSKDDDSVETWSQKLLEEPVEGWDDVFRTNVTNIFLMTSAFLPLLAKFTYGGDAAGRAIYEKYQTGVCVLLPCFSVDVLLLTVWQSVLGSKLLTGTRPCSINIASISGLTKLSQSHFA